MNEFSRRFLNDTPFAGQNARDKAAPDVVAARTSPADCMAEPGPPVAVTTNSDQGTKSAWRRPAGGPTARAASPRRRADYRFELRLLVASALVWMVTGAVLWGGSAGAAGRAGIAADPQATKAADTPWRATASEAPAADSPNGADSTSSPLMGDAVDGPVADFNDADDDDSDDDSSDDGAGGVAMAAQNPLDAATASQLLAAGPPAAMGGEALARPPPSAAVEPAAVPSDAASGRLYLQGPATFSPAVAPAESPPSPVRAPVQSRRRVVSGSQTSGATAYSRDSAFDAAAPREAGRGALRPATATVQPIAVASDPQLDRLLTEAWGLIERGDHGPGRLRFLQARRLAGDDPLADFSLGLLDSLLENDWSAAEKRFADCVRRTPANVPSLNNLAIAEAMNRHEAQAVKRWHSVVEANAALGAPVPEGSLAMFPWRGLPQNPPVISREPTTPYPRRNRTRR